MSLEKHTDSTLDNTKTFVFEHLDGPVVQKEDGTFENTDGESYAFFPSNDSENEEMSYSGSGSDNGMLIEPKKKSLK